MATGDESSPPPAYLEKSQEVWVAMKDERQQDSLYPVQHVLLQQQHLPEQKGPPSWRYGPLQQLDPSGQTTRSPVVACANRPLMECQQERTSVTTEEGDVPTYMGLSVFTCLCCCWPIGLCAIAQSSKANDAKSSGDIDRAKKASSAALFLNISAIVLGVILLVVFIIFQFGK